MGKCKRELVTIAEGSRLIDLPHKIALCAQTLFHHLDARKEVVGEYMPFAPVVLLFVACKVEEHPCSIIQILQLLEYFVAKQAIRSSLADPAEFSSSQLTGLLRECIVLTERYILKAFGFAVYSFADYPHKYIPSLAARLQIRDGQLQRLWNICNDSLQDDLVCSYSGLEMAWACVVVALQDKSILTHRELARMEVDGAIVEEIAHQLTAAQGTTSASR